MISFRYLLGVSTGAVISLCYGSNVIAEQAIVSHQNHSAIKSSSPQSDQSNRFFSSLELAQQQQNREIPQVEQDSGDENGRDAPVESEEVQPDRLEQFENNETNQSGEETNFLETGEEKDAIENTDSLNPSSNPLLFPTDPEEVTINEDDVVPITLEQALQLARKNNQRLREARLNVEQAQEQLREQQGAKFPTLSVQSQLRRNTSAAQEISAAGSQFQSSGVTTDLNTTLELTYDIYTGGQRSARIERAKSQLKTQRLALEQTAQQLRLDVTNAYYDLQEADAQVRIAEASVQEAEQILRDAELLKQAGLGTRFDVLQAEVRLGNEEQNLRQAKARQKTRRRELTRILGISQQVEVIAANAPKKAGEWDLSLEESIVRAYQNRSELEQQLEQRDIGEANKTIALSRVRPQVNFFARYTFLERIDDPTSTGTGDGLAIGAQVQWNFFDGGQAQARAEQAEKDIAIAENRFSQTRNQIRQEVEQAFFQLQANEQNIETAELAVKQAEESLRLARLRFQAGVGTQTDVITAQRDLTNARGNLLTAIIDYNRSLASLKRAVSNLPDNRLFEQTSSISQN